MQILPKPEAIVTPAIDAMAETRPRVRRHIERGRYGDVAHGWVGEARVFRAELAQRVASRFIGTATGDDLTRLAQSDEFGAPVTREPSIAYGRVRLRRQETSSESTPGAVFGIGEIPRGARFRISANPRALPQIQESTVEAIEPVSVDGSSTVEPLGGGEFEHTQEVWVPVVSLAAGQGPNIPLYGSASEAVEGQVLSEIFDPSFEVVAAELAGGGQGLSDAAVRQAGMAAYTGRHAPTTPALVMAALCTGLGVERVAVVEDTVDGITQLFIADASWAANVVWAQRVQRALQPWIGFGCRARVLPVTNATAHVTAALRLSDARHREHRTEITNAVRAALVAYFDERSAFWMFDTAGMASAIARADRRRILAVPTAPMITDASGVSITPPSPDPINVESVQHFALRSVTLMFQRPDGSEV